MYKTAIALMQWNAQSRSLGRAASREAARSRFSANPEPYEKARAFARAGAEAAHPEDKGRAEGARIAVETKMNRWKRPKTSPASYTSVKSVIGRSGRTRPKFDLIRLAEPD